MMQRRTIQTQHFLIFPLWNINEDNIVRPQDFVKIENADEVTESALFTYSASSSDSAKLTASFNGNGDLVLDSSR